MASSLVQITNERLLDQSDADGVGFVESFLLKQLPSAYKLSFEDLPERVKGARRDHDCGLTVFARVSEASIDCLLSRYNEQSLSRPLNRDSKSRVLPRQSRDGEGNMQPLSASLSLTIKWLSLRAWGCADRRFRGSRPDRRGVSRVIDNQRRGCTFGNYMYTLLSMVSRDRQTLYDRSVMMCCTTQQHRPGCGNGVAQFHVTHGSAFLFRRGIPRSSALYCCIPVRIPRCHSPSSHGKDNRLEEFFVSLKRDTASLCNRDSPFTARDSVDLQQVLRVCASSVTFDLWAGCRRAICKHDGSHAAEPEVLGWSDFTIFGSRSMGVRGKQQQAQTEA